MGLGISDAVLPLRVLRAMVALSARMLLLQRRHSLECHFCGALLSAEFWASWVPSLHV